MDPSPKHHKNKQIVSKLVPSPTTNTTTNNLQDVNIASTHHKPIKPPKQSSLLSLGFTRTTRPPPGASNTNNTISNRIPTHSTNNPNGNNNNNNANKNDNTNNNICISGQHSNLSRNDTPTNHMHLDGNDDDDDDDDIMTDMEQQPTRQYTPTPTKHSNTTTSCADIVKTPPRSNHTKSNTTARSQITNSCTTIQHTNTTINNISSTNSNINAAPSQTCTNSNNIRQNMRKQRKRHRYDNNTNTAQQQNIPKPQQIPDQTHQQPLQSPSNDAFPPRKRQRSTFQPLKPPLPQSADATTNPQPSPPILPPPPPPSLTISAHLPAINQYTCYHCNNIFTINKHGWHDGSIRPYLVQFVCQQCTSNLAPKHNKRNHNTSIHIYSIYKCTQSCPKAKSPFNNKHALNSENHLQISSSRSRFPL